MAQLDLTKLLDKEHETKPLAEVLALSPAALEGVTDKDAEHLAAAFGIRTIADMARNKFFLRARLLLDAAEMTG